MPASIPKSTYLLAKKNLLLRRHALTSLLCTSLILPLTAVCFVIMVWGASFKGQASDIYDSVSASEFNKYVTTQKYGPLAIVRPSGGDVVAGRVFEELGSGGAVRVFENEEGMDGWCGENPCLAGVVLSSSNTTSPNFAYTLRLDELSKQMSRFDDSISDANGPTANVQMAVERAILGVIEPAVAEEFGRAEVNVRQVLAAQIKIIFYDLVRDYFGGLLYFGFVPMAYTLMAGMVHEKEVLKIPLASLILSTLTSNGR